MSRTEYVLGLDVSTTATKALLMALDGSVAGVAAATYGYATPQPLWSEQDPALWWDGTCRAIRQVLAESGVAPEAVLAIGVSGQMHGLVLLDADGAVLRPALLWNDQRTQAQCAAIEQRLGRARLIELTGNLALTGFTAPKLAWVREHEPEIYQQIATILLPKDYVRYRLTGARVIDKADASGTLWFDVARRTWSSEVLDALEVDSRWLPEALEGTAISGYLHTAGATATGLPAGIPVVAGGGDQAANAVGTGVIDEGELCLSLGTSGVIFAPTNAPRIEAQGRLHAFCHAVPERWHLMGVMLSAAGSLRWYRDTLAPGVEFDALLDAAQSVPAGSAGLQFMPYLTGERTPHPDPLARGGFVGLTVRHTQAHLTRAVLEGVAFGLRDSLELMRATGLGSIQRIRASGGGTRSALWRQILADVLGVEIVLNATSEGAAYGAALLAAVGAGRYPTAQAAAAATIQTTSVTPPGPDRATYDAAYAVYRQLYPSLQAQFAPLGALEA